MTIVLLEGAASPARAVDDVTARRVAGSDRYGTAAAIARDAFPDGAIDVVLSSGETFADAAGSAALGAHLRGPVLLTQHGRIPPATESEIDRLGARAVTIVGGSSAVSVSVEKSLRDRGLVVRRVAGPDRYATAANVASEIGAAGTASLESGATVLVGSGEAFGDILAMGSLIGAHGDGDVFPVLLVRTSSLPDTTAQAMDSLDVRDVIIMGGQSVVDRTVEQEIEAITGRQAFRIAGVDRFETAVDAAEWALVNLDNPATRVILANGMRFPDGLTAGVLAARSRSLVLTTDGVSLSSNVVNFLGEHTATIQEVTAVGGTSAVSDDELREAEVSAEPGQND